MIEADPPVWNNIITSFPKAKKFRTKPFPLFDTLGELYDGHTAEGSWNITSIDPMPSVPANIMQLSESEALESDDFSSATRQAQPLSLVGDDDDEVRILQQPSQICSGTTSSRPAASKREKEFVPPNAGRKASKKQKQEDAAGMLQKYLEVKTQQVEGEFAVKAKAVAEADDFSIKNCISRLNTIEELSGEEKAEAFDVFKDEQNRQIFMTAEPISCLIWLRKEIGSGRDRGFHRHSVA